MRLQLPGQGLIVQPQTDQADYKVSATVTVVPASPGQSRVEIQWIVRDTNGRDAGHVAQLNEVPRGSLDHYWGEVAATVAQQAAGGVQSVIANQLITHRDKPAGG